MKKLFKNVMAATFGIVVFFIVFYATAAFVGFIARIPIIGAIFYWPSDAPWARLVLPPCNAVFAGAYVSAHCCESATLFSICIAALYVLNLVLALIGGCFSWALLVTTAIVLVSAFVCLVEMRDCL